MKKLQTKRIAALVPNILGVSPGQRVRIETWTPHLQSAGWTVDFYPFEDERLHEVLYGPGRMAAKMSAMLRCYARHFKRMLEGPPCDVLFVFREAALIGPALLERLAKRLGAPLVYDVDDPVFLRYQSPTNGWFSLLKCHGKTHTLFRLSDQVIAINGLIGDYAAGFNPNVTVIPNGVDVDRYAPAPTGDPRLRLVWIGSHSSMSNLATVAEPLRRFQQAHDVPLRVIGAGEVALPEVAVELRQWTAQTEVADLQGDHIGIVPLTDHPWNHWKLFFKTLQYMAVGLPVVARKLGANAEMIQDGVNGFLVETADEWRDRLCLLAANPALRRQLGTAARQTVIERYSSSAQMKLVTGVFERAIQRS